MPEPKKSIKICLYLEFYHFLGGVLFKNIGTGLLSSYKNQKRVLEAAGIEYVEKWDNSCDILQINTPWLKSIWLIKRARAKGKKIIIWAHVTAEDAREVFWFGPAVAPLLKKYLTYAYGLADTVFCPTAYTKSLLVAYGLSAEKIVVQSNGVDLKQFYPDNAERQEIRNQFKVQGMAVGTVGLVVPRKGVKTFVAMAGSLPGSRFLWFGAIYSALLAKPLPKNIPGNVTFTGYVQNIRAAFNALDIFVFPSYEENQGMVILEAAAVGLPILVRDIPVYEAWLVHEKNCLKAKSEEDFLVLLNRLVSDQELRSRLSEGAKKLAEREDVNHFGEKLISTYQKLLGSKN